MPKAGEIKRGFAKEATPQGKELARALRELHRIIIDFDPEHPTAKAISKSLFMSEQHVSNFLHAKRLPREDQIVALSSLAEQALNRAMAAGSYISLRYSLDDLLRLRKLAIRPCSKCRDWHDAVVSNEVESRLAGHRRADDVASAGVPVPLPRGDRHPGRAPLPPLWAGVEEVRQLSKSGLEAELLTLLVHLSSDTEPDEVPSIIHTLQTSGLGEAADAVLDAVAARPAQAVLEVAFELDKAGLGGPLRRLLFSARRIAAQSR